MRDQMKRKIRRLVLVVLVLVLVAVLTPRFAIERSESFSWGEFEAIEIGSPVDAAIVGLGDPLRIEKHSSVSDCPKCSSYFFLGNPPDWLPIYKEAWLVVDVRGKVVRRVTNLEP